MASPVQLQVTYPSGTGIDEQLLGVLTPEVVTVAGVQLVCPVGGMAGSHIK
ncbi:MAG TPA: hypothetical protein VMU53_07895 [Candidatus Sulfotelmatobacter sp.]|nr:hypothetical protein [Candidatus Sulfotelmatobacter sp.]